MIYTTELYVEFEIARFVYRRSHVSYFDPQRSFGNDFNYSRQINNNLVRTNELYFIVRCLNWQGSEERRGWEAIKKKYSIFGNHTGQLLDSYRGKFAFKIMCTTIFMVNAPI